MAELEEPAQPDVAAPSPAEAAPAGGTRWSVRQRRSSLDKSGQAAAEAAAEAVAAQAIPEEGAAETTAAPAAEEEAEAPAAVTIRVRTDDVAAAGLRGSSAVGSPSSKDSSTELM